MEQQVLERILEISRRMAETRSLEPLLDYAMAEAIDLTGAERGYLVLINEGGGLDFRVKRDREGNQLEHAEDQISTSIFNQVISSHAPLVVTDALSDPKFGTAQSVLTLKLHSVMCVPLIARGTAIGAIYVENRSGIGIFSDEDAMPLTLFANQAAVSIENAILNDQLEQHVVDRTQELQGALNQLERSWQQAVEADRLRTEVLSYVAHDVRAPLNVAITALTMFTEGDFGDLTEEQSLWISKALQGTKHARALMNDVFDMARIEAGKMQLDIKPTRFGEFAKQIYDIGQGLPHPETVDLLLDLDPDLPETVPLDETRIRQVMFNLISNAIKFTSKGSITIYAKPLPDERAILMGVRDTGEGIPPDKLETIFDRFTQADMNMTRRRMGMGLGLAICRELVMLHDGHIWAESPEGGGAEFNFTLPLPDNPPPSEEAEEADA